jgi:polar amino acid transport system ATP-binding protein
MIELRQISKYINGNQALDNLSLKFDEHEMVCLIGSMGSGKSTLLRCLDGHIKPDSGEILFSAGKKPRTGMIFQHFNLFPHLNVLQNLTLAPMKVLGLSAREAEDLALEQLKSVGLVHKCRQYPNELSVGQQQRVAIARCLMMNPQIILLDEPLSSLDPIATGEVMDVLRKLKKEKTLIMATHNHDAISDLADRVVFMDKGRVCEEGIFDQVINSPLKDETRSFVRHMKDLLYNIESPDFDRPELNARIEQYCNRFGLGTKAFHFTQLAVEEVLNIIPIEKGVQLTLSKSEQEVRMTLEMTVEDSGVSYIDPDTCRDELSLSLIQGLCDVLGERVEGNQRILHLELNKESLLK